MNTRMLRTSLMFLWLWQRGCAEPGARLSGETDTPGGAFAPGASNDTLSRATAL